MTTIVYDHKKQQIAVDSRMSKHSGEYVDTYIKYRYRDDVLFMLTGSTCDIDYFVDNYKKYAKTNLDGVSLDCSGLMVRDGIVYSVFLHEDVFNEDIISNNESCGSGGKYALAALDFGKSAKEAVEYAATRDLYTGGKVRVYNINSAKWD